VAKRVEVPKWQAQDGTLFDTKTGAETHDAKGELREIVNRFFYNMSVGDITFAIFENREDLKKVLRKCR